MFDSFRVKRRLGEVEEALAKVKRDFSALELEWTDTLDKIKRMMGRVAKRAEVVEKAEEGEEAIQLDRPPGLSQRQASINAQIIARRRGAAS